MSLLYPTDAHSHPGQTDTCTVQNSTSGHREFRNRVVFVIIFATDRALRVYSHRFLTYQRLFHRSLYSLLCPAELCISFSSPLCVFSESFSATWLRFFERTISICFFSQRVADATPRMVWSTSSVHIERTYRLVVRSLSVHNI